MSTFNERKNMLQTQIIEYHDLEGVKNRPEREVYIMCALHIAKNLRSMSSLHCIYSCYSNSTSRIIALAEWILKHIDLKKQNQAKKHFRDLEISGDIKKLKNIYNLAILYPLDECIDEIKLNNEMNFKIKEKEMKLTLSEYVFRYFRYYHKNPVTLLDSKAFQFKELLKNNSFMIPSHDKTSLITAYCQSGKTFLVIPVVLIYLALGFTPVLIVLDRSQVRQLMRRLRIYCIDLKNHLRSLGHFTDEELMVFNDNFIYYDSMTKKTEEDNNLELALSSVKPKIVIAIKHHQHIKRINDCVTEESNILLVADEAQVSCCYKNLDSETYHNASVKYDNEFVKLRESCYKYIMVSATVQDIIMVDRSLYSDNIVYIPPNEYYTGISKWIFKNIVEDDDDSKNSSMNVVINILNELSKETPIMRYDRRHKIENEHPIICLIKTDRKKDEHLLLMECFMKGTLSPEINDGNWCVVVEHGEGFYLHHSTFDIDKPIMIENQQSVIKSSDVLDKNTKTHYFSSNNKNSIDISDVFQYLANEGVKRFPRIALISYDMCKEAISFTSHYDKPHNYHLTHGIFYLGSKTSISIVLQTMNRMSGNHGDNIRPVVYTTEKTKKDVLYGFDTHDRQVKELIDISTRGNICISAEYLETFPIFKNRCSSNYNKVKGIEKNLVKNPDKEKEEAILNKHNLDSIKFLCQVNEEYKDEKNKNIEMYGSDYYDSDEEDDSSDDESSDGLGIIINKPKSGTVNFNTYIKVCEYIKNKGWIRQAEIRKHSGIDDTRQMNALRKNKNDENMSTGRGLKYRKIGSQYEYIFM